MIRSPGPVQFKAGRFHVELKTELPEVLRGVNQLYGDTLEHFEYIDFSVSIDSQRSYWKPQASFGFNGEHPFAPLPKSQGLPLLEWGLNWCVTRYYHQSLLIHAAVVEKEGRAIVLPGTPGSGKSTLTAALVSEGGWNLFSDELALIDLTSGEVWANPRPVSLKNQSIEIIKSYSPKQSFTASVKDTIKGTVSHMVIPESAKPSLNNSVPVSAVIFPKYIKDSEEVLERKSAGESFIFLVENSFNYHVLGASGFQAMSLLLDSANCYSYKYDGNLSNALTTMESIL